jgi:hypothetical protein
VVEDLAMNNQRVITLLQKDTQSNRNNAGCSLPLDKALYLLSSIKLEVFGKLIIFLSIIQNVPV